MFIALWYGFLPERLCHRGSAITAADLEGMLADLPDDVLLPMKKKRGYISRYLSENEVDRERPRNRKLFKRFKRGHYILNPNLKIRLADQWHDLHQLLRFDGWSYINLQETDSVKPHHYNRYDRDRLQRLLAKNLVFYRDSIEELIED